MSWVTVDVVNNLKFATVDYFPHVGYSILSLPGGYALGYVCLFTIAPKLIMQKVNFFYVGRTWTKEILGKFLIIL